MRKNGVIAAAYMRDLAMHGATGVRGLCLRTCRLAWGLPGGTPSAIAAWREVPIDHRHADPTTAPVGAPHFWTGNYGGLKQYGHIALQAEHEGYVWSTDAPISNKVGMVDLLWFETHWSNRLAGRRCTYLGWTDMLQGQHLPLGLEAPKKGTP